MNEVLKEPQDLHSKTFLIVNFHDYNYKQIKVSTQKIRFIVEVNQSIKRFYIKVKGIQIDVVKPSRDIRQMVNTTSAC